jgi:hypothetical protein
MNQGWECPRCHRCWAPTVKKCKECKPVQVARPVPPSYPYWVYQPWPVYPYQPYRFDLDPITVTSTGAGMGTLCSSSSARIDLWNDPGTAIGSLGV